MLKEYIVVFGACKTTTRKHVMWDEYIRIRYMAILVNRMDIHPTIASHLAGELMKCLVVMHNKTWVEHRGLSLGVPIIEEQR